MNYYEEGKRAIQDFWLRNGRLPSYRELLPLVPYTSTSGVAKLVDVLIEEGYLTRDNGKLSPGNMLTGLPFPGVVEAGFPSPAQEALDDRLDLYTYIVQRPERTYIHQVTGDSMINAGIYEGDLIVSELGAEYHEGDIVIAQVEDGYTVKYLRKNKYGFYLEAANPAHRDIYPSEQSEIEIIAVVRAVIRRLT